MEQTIIDKGEELINILLQNCITNACKYSKSAGRNNISSQDIIIALKYEAHEFQFTNFTNSNDTNIYDSDESKEDEEEEENPLINEEFSISVSNDPLIVKMNEYHNKWDDWKPDHRVETTLKNAVNEAMKTFKNS